MADDLRLQLEAAVFDEIERTGPDDFKPGPVVERFVSLGVARSTAYRWVDRVITSGRAGQHLTDVTAKAQAARAARAPDPAANAAAEIAERLPTMPTTLRRGAVARQGGMVAVLDRISDCVDLADRVMNQACNPDGSVRLTKTAMQAAELMRRSLMAGVQLAESVRQLSRIDRFHDVMLEEIAKESPEVAERLARRLERILTDWRPEA